MSYKIGIDIGASKIILVLLSGLRVVKALKIVTPKNRRGLVAVLDKNIRELAGPKFLKGIGLAVTGPLSEKRNLMLNPPNQKYLSKYPLAAIIEKRIGVKTTMENDANCFTLGEALLGAGRGSKTILGITLGTGLGGGLVADKKICKGSFGALGEVGHMVIKFDGPKCTCGSYGCFEEYGSQRFFERKGYFPKIFAERASKGDKKVLEIYKEYGKLLGVGLGSLANILDPELIVLGGGISNHCKFFLKEAEKEMRKKILSPITKKKLKLKKAELGELAGAIGVSLLV